MGTTTNGLPYPESTDFVTDGAQAIEDLAVELDARIGLYKIVPTGATNGTVAANGDVTPSSAVNTVVVTGCFSSKYLNYRIIYTGGTASANGDLGFQLGSTITGYYLSGFYITYGGSTGNWTGSNAANWGPVGARGTVANHLNIDLLSPFDTTRTSFSAWRTAIDTGGASGALNGYINNNTSYTAFTLLAGSGQSITGGTIKVFGYN